MHKIALVLAIAAVGEGAVTLHLVRQLHLERENAQTLQARVTELERHAPPASAPGATFVAVPTQPTVSPFTVVQKSAAPVPQVPVVTSGVTAVNSFVAGNALSPPDMERMREQINANMERHRALLKDPEYREAMHSQQRVMMMRAHPDVAKDLDLSAEQANRFFDALADQSLRGVENIAAYNWNEQPDAANMQEINRKGMELQRANEAELKSVLGEAKFREWQDYQGSMGARFEVTRLRTSLASAGVPLDENQVRPLVGMLQEQQKKVMEQHFAAAGSAGGAQVGFITEPGMAPGDNSIQHMDKSLELMAQGQKKQRETLARVLTPEQLKVIEEEQNAELQMQRAQLRIMRAQQEAGLLDPAAQGVGNTVGYIEQGVTFAPSVSD
jgi:hypothetical protein